MGRLDACGAIPCNQRQQSVKLAEPNMHERLHNMNPALAVAHVAASDGLVLISLVDEIYVSMAVNFYLTSLRPFDIRNYLFFTLQNDTCKKVQEHHPINCVHYRPANYRKDDEDSGIFGSAGFLAKMNARTDLIVDILAMGYSVLHTDVDVIYLKNPLKYIDCKRGSCDIAALMDGLNSSLPDHRMQLNAGFILLHPSALPVYRQMQLLVANKTTLNDQLQLREVLKTTQNIRVRKLPTDKFLCGRFYYEERRRNYADSMAPCPGCIVVHNNWIVSMEAKMYRAKELHQWVVDDDEYYSSTTRKYFTYDNSAYEPPTVQQQIGFLKLAITISSILNRTLILPKFYCEPKIECALNHFIRIRNLDSALAGRYREHSFLIRHLVPREVRYSVYQQNVFPENITDTILWQRFNNITHPILKFRTLEFDVIFDDAHRQRVHETLISDAIFEGSYINE